MPKFYVMMYILGGFLVLDDVLIIITFAVVFVAGMIEAKRIEKKAFPIVSNLLSSAITGWGATFGVKYFKPEWFESDARIFVMLITTLFSYGIVVYFLKGDIIPRLVEKYLNKKTNNGTSNDTNDSSSGS